MAITEERLNEVARAYHEAQNTFGQAHKTWLEGGDTKIYIEACKNWNSISLLFKQLKRQAWEQLSID